MGTAKYQKMCWIITQTETIIWVSGRETDLIVVQYKEYELELVLHSLQPVKAPNSTGVHFNYSNSNNNCNSASSTHSLNRISRNYKKRKGKQARSNPTQYQHDRDPFLS